MKVSVQTDAQAWKVQADAGQAAMFWLCALLHHQSAHAAPSNTAGAVRLVAPGPVFEWRFQISPDACLWVQMLPHVS